MWCPNSCKNRDLDKDSMLHLGDAKHSHLCSQSSQKEHSRRCMCKYTHTHTHAHMLVLSLAAVLCMWKLILLNEHIHVALTWVNL